MILALLGALARAELPPPDYRDALMEAAREEIARVAEERGVDAAETLARRWSRTVGDDARIDYELGLAYRKAGQERRARAAIERALDRDPHLTAARYDLGEILLNGGDVDAAEVEFQRVAAELPAAWPGHFRLADCAARRGDADGFQTHLLAALRHGFQVRAVAADPRWKGYLADPSLGPVLRRLVAVYQDESVLRDLEAPP